MYNLPEELKPFIDKLRLELGLANEPIVIPITPIIGASAASCFENVAKLISKEGGRTKYGWILHIEPYMITAEFHAIWENGGILRDITPDDDQRVNARVFIIDEVKTYNGERISNVMVNVSGNNLIDDYIALKRAAFEFMETGDRKEILGRINLDYEDQIRWDILTFWSYNLMSFYEQRIDSLRFCFCSSESGYEKCHGLSIKKLCNEITNKRKQSDKGTSI